MSINTDTIQIKGLRDGLLVTLGSGEWQELQELLFTQIDERSTFFRGARLALDVESQELRVADLSRLRDKLSEREVSLWAVISKSPKTVQTAQLLGLATRVSKTRQAKKTRSVVDAGNDDTALWIQRTLRSGMRIEHPDHVVVMGDVNPGAEIVAGGNILIWGRLRGSVHAGASFRTEASENSGAFICALAMDPTKLQIASEIANPSKVKQSKKSGKISLKNGKFLVETWRGK
ncbi:MAG: septum site-determining protein MinC [Anaerolineae bacterium]|jgi:septum site-determining protein MinC|nr:septum site-determining protein MinC [Anaerolineae bacterium]MBT3713707.1 septum site-determining protein MinC [Anaerolineae bacterium]MBT4457410.1 septum site-determining protein MinC [Anaerolineae bacterium]MBT6060472.1 septum site-determining protein MinC [Anaerolineae bacterium]MBT6323243.1 septum site-determining protein MinC [Anaerolineae bacterium]